MCWGERWVSWERNLVDFFEVLLKGVFGIGKDFSREDFGIG